MTPTARVRLLGRLEVSLDSSPDGPPPQESARAELLVVHLLLHRSGPLSRQRVAGLFWPESTEAQARTNLRHVVHTLRTRMPGAERYVEVTARTLRWRSEEPCWLDVEEFERLLGAGDPDGRERALREAVALYAGDLLEGYDDEWLHPERHRLRQRYLDALTELAALGEARGDLAAAISAAEELLRSDPLREETYRHLMKLHAARGDRARAVAVYHDCSSTLERELGVAPAAATRAAYAALLSQEPAAPGQHRSRPEAGAGRSGRRAGPARHRLAGGRGGMRSSCSSPVSRGWARPDSWTTSAHGVPAAEPLSRTPAAMPRKAHWRTGRWWPGCGPRR